MDLAETLGVRDAGRAGRGEAWLAGVSQLIACLDEGLRKEPRAPGDFELLAQQLRGQRRREAEKVVAQRMKSSRAVAEAQSALGRFLDKRAASVQEASCAASDAQGRLQRLQEQSNGVRAVALRKAQAQVADVEQRALHEARARNAMLDRRESEIQALKRQTASLSTACNACCGDLMNISQTLEAAASQASEVNHEKSLVQTRCLRLDAREAALQTMERAWKEVARSSPISARSQAKALDAARDHLVRALLRDKVFTGKMNQLLDGLQEASPAAKNFPSPASDPSNDQSLGPSEAKEEGASADSTADAGEGNENLSVVWSPVNGSAASQGKESTTLAGLLVDAQPTDHGEETDRNRSPEKSPVPRSVTAPPRRLGRWPSSKSLTRMRSPTRIVVQTLPPSRLQPLGGDTPKTPITVARHYSQSQPLSATLPLQVVIAHERACKSPVREGHERAEPVRFISASGNVAAHERGRKNVGRETLGEHVETVRFISASGSHARELSLEKPARPAPPPQSVRQATYRATSSERQPKTPQMPCRTSQPRYQYSPQPRQTHQVIQPQQPQQPQQQPQQPAQPLAQSPPRYQLLAHQQSPQPRVQYFNPASYAQTAPMVVPRLPGTNLTVLPPQTVVWPGQPRRE